MRTPPNERSPAVRSSGASRKNVRPAKLNNPTSKATPSPAQAIRPLTARLAYLADWKEDIEARIADASDRLDRGALYQDQLDDLIDAVEAWRQAADRLVFDILDEFKRAV